MKASPYPEAMALKLNTESTTLQWEEMMKVKAMELEQLKRIWEVDQQQEGVLEESLKEKKTEFDRKAKKIEAEMASLKEQKAGPVDIAVTEE